MAKTPEQTEMMISVYRGVREESHDEVVAEIAEILKLLLKLCEKTLDKLTEI